MADKDTLQAQLTELNSRSRWYSSELWQIPFAYLGVTGFSIAQLAGEEKAQPYIPLACLLAAVFGFFVIWHMERIRELEQGAVAKLQKIEEELGLPAEQRAKEGKGVHVFQIAVLVFTVVYGTLAVVRCVA